MTESQFMPVLGPHTGNGGPQAPPFQWSHFDNLGTCVFPGVCFSHDQGCKTLSPLDSLFFAQQ